VLIELLRRVIKDERRHYAFYRAQAELRLARSHKARTATRWAMEHVWAPVGTGVRPQAETDFVVVFLFSDRDGAAMAREMDRSFSELPGMEGMTIYQDALKEAVRRFGPMEHTSEFALAV
jgi:hypothetical protein